VAKMIDEDADIYTFALTAVGQNHQPYNP
jgi:hypothetical protein